ncbi:MAG: Gfo/Idh/MocA family protein [Christensenellales bacterium]|jgi:hypothetical protein
MFKIGFIDYFLDEWHSNHYPNWIKEASEGDMAVTHAFGLIDGPGNKLTNAVWCKKNNIVHCQTVEELIAACDGLIVLSPNNPEMHLQLCEKALQSGKPTYVDKTFSPDLVTGEAIFAIADRHGTPCYSASALRYASEYQGIDASAITALRSYGSGEFINYNVHQLEPLCMLMQVVPSRVLCLTGDKCVSMLVQFIDGRHATVSIFEQGSGFKMDVCTSKGVTELTIQSDFFKAFIKVLVQFFRDSKVPVPHAETLRIMALREAGLRAAQTPGQWVDVPEQ